MEPTYTWKSIVYLKLKVIWVSLCFFAKFGSRNYITSFIPFPPIWMRTPWSKDVACWNPGSKSPVSSALESHQAGHTVGAHIRSEWKKETRHQWRLRANRAVRATFPSGFHRLLGKCPIVTGIPKMKTFAFQPRHWIKTTSTYQTARPQSKDSLQILLIRLRIEP